jgi:hypothetical protein
MLPIVMLVLSGVLPEAVPMRPIDVFDHRTGKLGVIHSSTGFGIGERDVTLKVIVDAQGNVESARAVDGPSEFFRDAEKLEAERKFKPFDKGGAAVRAIFEDAVSIVPPER